MSKKKGSKQPAGGQFSYLKFFVNQLPVNVKLEDLQKTFASVGPVRFFQRGVPDESGVPRTFGWIFFSRPAPALLTRGPFFVNGQHITVAPAREMPLKDPYDRSKDKDKDKGKERDRDRDKGRDRDRERDRDRDRDRDRHHRRDRDSLSRSERKRHRHDEQRRSSRASSSGRSASRSSSSSRHHRRRRREDSRERERSATPADRDPIDELEDPTAVAMHALAPAQPHPFFPQAANPIVGAPSPLPPPPPPPPGPPVPAGPPTPVGVLSTPFGLVETSTLAPPPPPSPPQPLPQFSAPPASVVVEAVPTPRPPTPPSPPKSAPPPPSPPVAQPQLLEDIPPAPAAGGGAVLQDAPVFANKPILSHDNSSSSTEETRSSRRAKAKAEAELQRAANVSPNTAMPEMAFPTAPSDLFVCVPIALCPPHLCCGDPRVIMARLDQSKVGVLNIVGASLQPVAPVQGGPVGPAAATPQVPVGPPMLMGGPQPALGPMARAQMHPMMSGMVPGMMPGMMPGGMPGFGPFIPGVGFMMGGGGGHGMRGGFGPPGMHSRRHHGQ